MANRINLAKWCGTQHEYPRLMLSASSAKIWLYLGGADMRKQFDGLAGLVNSQMQMQAQLGDWFVFVNRKCIMMKVLYYHQGGFCLWSKRLERGTFAYSGDGEHRFRFYREHLNFTHWVLGIFNLSVHDGQF